MTPDSPTLTVVVSTYGRPDALTCALRSLRAQSFRHWVAYVIGDACDERTEAAVRAIDDRRFWYCNLPARTGDQSGPNSVGAAVATTPLLAFLNQDDILLPDHLEVCVRALDATGAEFCVAAAVRVRERDWLRPGGVVAERPARPRLSDAAVLQDQASFEPASSWVLRRAAYERVGPWRDAAGLYRTPINDWLLRAAGAGITTHHPRPVTVLRVSDHARPDGLGYDTGAATQLALLERLDEVGPDALREELIAATASTATSAADRSAARRSFWAVARAIAPAFVILHARFGLDPYVPWCQARGRRRGWWKTWALALRTGEAPLSVPNRQLLLQHARRSKAAHVIDGRWHAASP